MRSSEVQQKALVAALLGGMVLLSLAGRAQHLDKARASLSTGQVVASIRTAILSTPGRVLRAQAEVREGHSYCDVQILAADGSTRKVAVDVVSNTIIPWGEETPGQQIRRRERVTTSEAAVLAWPTS